VDGAGEEPQFLGAADELLTRSGGKLKLELHDAWEGGIAGFESLEAHTWRRNETKSRDFSGF
jgi:hypothetical protein